MCLFLLCRFVAVWMTYAVHICLSHEKYILLLCRLVLCFFVIYIGLHENICLLRTCALFIFLCNLSASLLFDLFYIDRFLLSVIGEKSPSKWQGYMHSLIIEKHSLSFEWVFELMKDEESVFTYIFKLEICSAVCFYVFNHNIMPLSILFVNVSFSIEVLQQVQPRIPPINTFTK